MPYFRVDYNEQTGETFTVRLAEWQVSRRSRRARYPYLTGGTDSKYFGHELLISCIWEYLSAEEAARIKRMIASIRSGSQVRVRIFGTDDDEILGFPFSDGSGGTLPASQRGWPVDLEDDETSESTGNIIDLFPLEINLITKVNVGAGAGDV